MMQSPTEAPEFPLCHRSFKLRLCTTIMWTKLIDRSDRSCQQYRGDKPLVIIGDVHGCADELEDLLHACDNELKLQHGSGIDSAKVIFAGDLVNKGPKSRRCIKIAIDLGALSVRGNHDHASICAVHSRNAGVEPKAKYDWTAEIEPDELSYLNAMPLTIALPAHGSLVVHAGLSVYIVFYRHFLSSPYVVHLRAVWMRVLFAVSSS